MIGTEVGPYRVLARLGAGGMGEVYRAHDERLDRDVALKVLPSDRFEDATARARLVREARAAASLNHPGICTIYEVGEAGGQAYIAMELVEGRPLDLIVLEQPPSPADVTRYGAQIADALAHAHAHGIVHRDLKCANIVVGADGRVKVLDFGLARKTNGRVLTSAATREHAVTVLTEPGQVAGTVAYMAPEQLRGEPADARSDLWALGVVLYELAAGSRPFAGASSFEVSSNILTGRPPALPARIPNGLRAVIDRCLEKDPSRRYQAASAVSAALQAIDAKADPAGTATRVPRAAWAAVAAVVVLSLTGMLIGTRFRGIGSPAGVAPARITSLAVLPMDNLSGDAAQDYFADGITEVLSTDLARLSGLQRVIGRGSVARFKGTVEPLADIAHELNVDALVTGSVLRSGNRISITAHLLDPATGEELWANRYDRHLQDVLTVRNEIVSAIVGEIRAQLSPEETTRLSSAAAVQPDAFEAYLQGHFHWLKQTREGYDLAERYFQAALDKDPSYALAYAGLSSVWMMRGDVGLVPPAEAFPEADALLAKALALDDSAADLHVTVGNHRLTFYDWAGAEREFRRAIDINPNLADAHFFYADLLLGQRRPDEWKREIDRALELDPINEFDVTYYGWHLNYLGRYDEAIPVFERLLPTAPNKGAVYLGLWGAQWGLQRYDQAFVAAKAYFLETAYVNRESPLARLAVVWDWKDLHADPRFQDLLHRLNLPQDRQP